MNDRVYLDWNATAPLRPEARAAMLAAMDAVGNPSSVHAEGRAARAIVERARGQVAQLVGCAPPEVVFTSGATEAASLFISGCSGFTAPATEHDCIALHPTTSRAALWDVSEPASPSVDPGLAVPMADPAQGLGLSLANGETGIVTDVRPFAPDGTAARRAALLCDAVQALGRLPVSLADLGASGLMASAHKLGGPKGVGALCLAPGRRVEALLPGGGQEMGRRSGTENVIGIAGFGAAAEAAERALEQGVWDRVAQFRDILEETLATAAPGTIFIGRDGPRLPNTACFAMPGWKGETQVMAMDLAGYAISAGAACSSGKVKESRVLRAMGYDSLTASSAVRVSLGPTTTEVEVLGFARTWIDHYRRWRARAA